MIYEVRDPLEWNPRVAFVLFKLYNGLGFMDPEYDIVRIRMLDKFVDLDTLCRYLVGDTRFKLTDEYDISCDYNIGLSFTNGHYAASISFWLMKDGEEPIQIEDMLCENHELVVVAPPVELKIRIADRFWSEDVLE
jgi:hypothetical protein